MNYSAVGRHENHQNAKSFYARASINNHQCLCLVDSGAESNLLPARYATDVRLRQSDKTLFAANGSQIEISGECTLTVRFGDQFRAKVKFIVSTVISEVILGADFLIEQKCNMNFAKGYLQCGRRRITLIKKNGARWARRIQTSEPITLQPLSQTIVPSKMLVGNAEGLKNQDWLLENKQIYPGVHLPRALYSGPYSDSAVEIVNLTSKSIQLKEDQILGELSPVEVTPVVSTNWECNYDGWADNVDDMIKKIPVEVPDPIKIKLRNVLLNYRDIFSQDEFDLGRCDIFKHVIDTGDARPVRQPLRRQPPHYQKFIDERVDVLLKQGVVVPAQSPWCCNVVLVKKKD